jgi:phenylalanyl-tRNA synthetase beta chain
MRIPLSWISLYTPLDSLTEKYTTKELAHEYSTHTAEIDAIEEYGLDKVVVAKVISCEKHPESKKLSIVRVDQWEYGEETILTWAANVVSAKYVAVAMVGAVLPWDFIISERPMAGMMSRGMICGADEIGMSKEESTGIMILENIWDEKTLEKMLGKSFFDLTLPFPWKNGEIYQFPLRDVMFEIDNKFITNRPDLFSVVGNAREFGAVFDLLFAPYSPNQQVSKSANQLSTKIETKNCLSYHLMKMEGIIVGKSPFGVSLMMERAWLGPKMDIVDITNLIMTELGQPMHAFDADKIVGDISVRMAKKWEKIVALNGSEYELTEQDMIIADESRPVAIAWVIGGMDSAVSEWTKNIIWESACFDATSVRLTAQRHGIRTDASTRYEKSLDPLLAGTTFSRVLEYMEFLGKEIHISGTSSYVDESQVNHITMDVDYAFIDMKAGFEIPKKEVDTILERLGFGFTPPLIGEDGRGTSPNPSYKEGKGSIQITVPSWRASKDIKIKEDIAEEVARVYGYDRTPLVSLSGGFSIGKKNHEANLRDKILAHLSWEKWHEIYTYSFTNPNLEKKILHEDMMSTIAVANAWNEEYTHMRRSLAPRIFLAAAENLKYADTFGFFEIGKVYLKSPLNRGEELKAKGGCIPSNEELLKDIEKKPFKESKKLAWVMVGKDIAKLRESIEWLLVRTIGYVPPVHTGTALTFLHPGVSGSYKEGDMSILDFGRIHPAVAENFGLPSDTLYFEADFETLLMHAREKDTRFSPISKYQTIPRELNFVMDTHTPTGEVVRTLSTLHPWITLVTVDSVFEDEAKVGAGKKSVNFAFTLVSHDATISDEEALRVQDIVIEEMGKLGYSLRS